jgi:hypothetical protein
MRALAIALIAAGLAWCVAGPLAACGGCSLVGCSGGVFVTIDGDLPWWPQGPYDAKVPLTGTIGNIEITGECPGSGESGGVTMYCHPGDSRYVSFESNTAFLDRPGGPLRGELRFGVPGQAEPEVLPFVTDEARSYSPNGESCDPTCYGRGAQIVAP